MSMSEELLTREPENAPADEMPPEAQNASLFEDDESASKYERSDGKTVLSLITFLLYEADIHEPDIYTKINRKGYGITEEIVLAATTRPFNLTMLKREFDSLPLPTVSQRQSFESDCNAPVIYRYRPRQKDLPLRINDIGVACPVMLIENGMIISSKKARPVLTLPRGDAGFPYFCEYVLKDRVEVGDWTMEYNQKTSTFIVRHKELGILYRLTGENKTSSHRMVLYILKKLSYALPAMDDNYTSDMFILKKKEEA